MDNAYHALIMAGSVLLFIIGITSAVYNYNKLIEANEKILTNSEYYNRNAENFQYTDNYQTNDELNTEDMQKIYSGAEIANMIFNMYTVKQIDVSTGLEIEEEDGIITNPDGRAGQQDSNQKKVKQIVNSDIAYSRITVGNDNFERSDNKLSGLISKIKAISAKGTRYIIDEDETQFKGSDSIVVFKQIKE